MVEILLVDFGDIPDLTALEGRLLTQTDGKTSKQINAKVVVMTPRVSAASVRIAA